MTLPAVEQLFFIEKALGVEPGHLTRHLGLLPAKEVARDCCAIDYLADDSHLSDEDKATLVTLYRFLRQRGEEKRKPG